MANERLRIVLDALNKASDDIKNVRKDIGELSDTTKKADASSKNFGDSWAGVLTGLNSGIAIAQQVVQAVKKVYETAREGAELEYLQSRFDNLTASIGTTSRALLGDMREATQGIYSDSELMASATDFMSLGLAKTHDEVVRLASVSGALNMNMNQLVLTLTNQTTMRFDALGVSVDGFDEKVKELEKSGLSASEAFNEAFLQQAEEQIERVGSAADESIGDFMRLEASFSNWATVVKTDISRILEPAIRDLADTLGNAADFQGVLNDALATGVITQEEYNHYQGEVHKGYLDINDVTEEVTKKTIAFDTMVDQTAEDMIAASIAGEDYSGAMSGVSDSTITADQAMRSYTETLLFNIASQGLSEEAALDLAIAMGLVDEKTMLAYEKMDDYKQLLDDSIITQEEYNRLVKEFGDELDGLSDVEVAIRLKWENVGSVTTGWGGMQNMINQQANRPTGGTVSAGNPYLWQEYRGGEIMVPSQDGYVLSRADAAAALAGGGGKQIVNNYNLTMPTSNSPADIATSFEILKAFGL